MRLLLVEDDEMIAETVVDSMRYLGYAIDWAADGRAAELSLSNGVYDLVLLDLGLPKCDGIQVLNTYRKAGGAASVIILTSSAPAILAIAVRRCCWPPPAPKHRPSCRAPNAWARGPTATVP